jgi:hypothetical protein
MRPTPSVRILWNQGHLRVEMRKLVCLLVAAQFFFISPAGAHSWYPEECCHDNDCRQVPCVELTKTLRGLMWRGLVIFKDTQAHDSQDQFCHVCVKSTVGFVPYVAICVFIPRVTS